MECQNQISPCGICGGHSGTRTGLLQIAPVFLCQYHSTNAAYSFVHLSLTLYNLSNWKSYLITHFFPSIWARHCTMTIQSEQYTLSNSCIMTYTENIIIVRTYSVCHNQENRPREEGMCEITDNSRNPNVTLFGCINLGSKLNPNKTRSWLHTSKCTWARSHKKWLTPMNRRWWDQSQQRELLKMHIS